MNKTYFIRTYGCQANIRDSQIISGTLDALGLIETNDFKKSDIIILNTCSVRQIAEDKVYGWGIKLGRTKKNTPIKYKKKGQQLVFITGCMVGSVKGSRRRYKQKTLQKKIPWGDYFLSPSEEYKIPRILVEENMLGQWALKTIIKPTQITKVEHQNKTNWAYINISTGCDNFCTFCVVPYSRGEEKSRHKDEIIEEVKHLASRGYQNIMLVGQNVNSWGLNRKKKFALRANSNHKIPFASLLREIHDIDSVDKVNFISSNPFDFTNDLINTLTLPKIDKYLHIAVQSGNNDILKKMNRRHTVEDFKKLIYSIKTQVPDMEFGTDAIVGFPTETEKQFGDTVKLFKEIPFKVAYISKYSPRKGTNAEKLMDDDVPNKIKSERHTRLTKIWQDSIVKVNNNA